MKYLLLLLWFVLVALFTQFIVFWFIYSSVSLVPHATLVSLMALCSLCFTQIYDIVDSSENKIPF
jgi:hypothetical protein